MIITEKGKLIIYTVPKIFQTLDYKHSHKYDLIPKHYFVNKPKLI